MELRGEDANVAKAIIPSLELAIGDAILPLLFPSACEDGDRRSRKGRQLRGASEVRRRLQHIVGISTKPLDSVQEGGESKETFSCCLKLAL